MSYQSTFTFVGTPVISKKENSKRPFCREIKKDGNKHKMYSLSFGVKESDTNMAFVEAFDGEQDVIKTFDQDGNKIEIDWENRFDTDYTDDVASYRKYTVDLGEDNGGRQEFITAYDMIQHLKKYLPDYDGRIVVQGNFVRTWYAKKNVYLNKYQIRNVYTAPDERKNRLLVVADLFYNRDSIDDSDFSETKKINVDCYIEQYINKDEGKKYVRFPVVLSAAKYDMENEDHKKLFDYKMRQLKVKNKNMVHIPWEIVLLHGAEEADFDESMLTDAQREQVELGIKSVDDFRPKGSIYGDKIDEFRLLNPKLTGDYENGVIDADDDMEEFDEKIYQPPQDETIEEAKNNSKKSKSNSDSKSKKEEKEDTEDDSDEDLF